MGFWDTFFAFVPPRSQFPSMTSKPSWAVSASEMLATVLEFDSALARTDAERPPESRGSAAGYLQSARAGRENEAFRIEFVTSQIRRGQWSISSMIIRGNNQIPDSCSCLASGTLTNATVNVWCHSVVCTLNVDEGAAGLLWVRRVAGICATYSSRTCADTLAVFDFRALSRFPSPLSSVRPSIKRESEDVEHFAWLQEASYRSWLLTCMSVPAAAVALRIRN